MLDDYLYSNHYYQKKVNLDPERCQINLERAIRRKNRELQVNIACQHTKNDWCQIRNITYEELEDFHECYWKCTGTVNKRVFVAQYLTVQPVSQEDRKKDLNITCHCPRKDGTTDLICQKSFISVLGVSKHKVLAIGRAKLLNSEQLYKETRGGNRKKRKNNIYNYSLESSNQSENEYYNKNKKNKLNNNNDEEDNENSDESEEVNVLTPSVELAESYNTSGLFEPEIDVNESFFKSNSNQYNDSSDDSDIEICSPEIPTVHITESQSNTSEDEYENDGNVGNMFEPDIEMNESASIISDKPISSQQSFHIEQRNEIYIRKKTQQFPHLIRKFNTKTTAASVSAVVRPQKYELVKININDNKNENINIRQQLQQCTPTLSSPTNNKPYLGPRNWKRTLARNQRRLQREREVSILCTHNMTRFCKIQCIPKEDLVKFHQEYWRCNGIVEERLFLARYIIVTPRPHRREMTIVHRIPSSDGLIYDVCQKSFLSVVGITKHKVQAAARAVLRGELLKKDGRGGYKIRNLKNVANNIKTDYDNGNNNNNYSQSKDCTLQIAQVIGNYKPDMSGEFHVEIKSEPAIEIEDSSDHGNYITFSEDNVKFENKNNEISNNIEISNIKNENEKIPIKNSRLSCVNKLNNNKIRRYLNYYMRKSENLIKDRKRLWKIINWLKKENIKLKTVQNY